MKDVISYKGLYKITETGEVFGIKRNKYLSLAKDHNGYPKISLCKGNLRKNHSVHRLVAQAFIPNPLNLPQVNHKNGNKTDNRVENLEWCTASFNLKHAHKLGLAYVLRGDKNPRNKISDTKVREIRLSVASGSKKQREWARLFNVSESLISLIVSGKNRKYS